MIKFYQFDPEGTVFCSGDGRFWISWIFSKSRWELVEPEVKNHGLFETKNDAILYCQNLVK